MSKLQKLLDHYLVHDEDCATGLTGNVKDCTCIVKSVKKNLESGMRKIALKMIGEDEPVDGYAPHNPERIAREDRNSVRAELRTKARVL